MDESKRESYLKINQAVRALISVHVKEPAATKLLDIELSQLCEKRNLCIAVFQGNFDPENPETVDTIVELFEQANDEIKEILKL